MNWTTLKNNVLDEVMPHIKEAIPSSWTPDRLIRALSSELRRERHSVLGPVFFITAGLIVGGAVALALAPKAGSDLRSDLVDKLNEMRRSARNGRRDIEAEA
jgi:hypothetical protein